MHQFTINSPLPCSSYRECTHITETKQASLNTTPLKCMLLLLHQAATFTNVTLSDLNHTNNFPLGKTMRSYTTYPECNANVVTCTMSSLSLL